MSSLKKRPRAEYRVVGRIVEYNVPMHATLCPATRVSCRVVSIVDIDTESFDVQQMISNIIFRIVYSTLFAK